MTPSISAAKADLRQKIRTTLANLSPALQEVESIELCERLEPQLRSAHTILFFATLPDELDLWPLLEKWCSSKVCALPAIDERTGTYGARRVVNPARDVVTGKFGVREPADGCGTISLSRLDLVLVPGLAFDLSGNRLGRGRGFYDRILAEAGGIKCGVCHDVQLMPEIPAESHDAKVGYIVTPSRVWKRRA